MNPFLKSTIEMINRHGLLVSYKRKSQGTYDPATSSVQKTETSVSLKAYPKHLKASQFSFPDLIGKESYYFYIANNSLGFVPKLGDSITFQGSVYRVNSIQSHIALGEVVLYRIVASKG